MISLKSVQSAPLNDTASNLTTISNVISEMPIQDFFTQLLKKLNSKDFSSFVEIIEDWEESFDLFSLLNFYNPEGWTLMHFACYKGVAEVVEFLVKQGAICNSESVDCWTPLQLACYNGQTESIHKLIKHGQLQINRSTSRGTALHQACRRGQSKDVTILLENGASMTIEDSNGLIPLQVSSNQEVFELIPKYMGEKLISSVTKKEVEIFQDIEISVNMETHDLTVTSIMKEGNMVFWIIEKNKKKEFKVVKIVDIYDMREVSPTLCIFQGKFGLLEIKTNSCRDFIQSLKMIIDYCHVHKIGYADTKEPEISSPIFQRNSTVEAISQVSSKSFEVISKAFEINNTSYFTSYHRESSSILLIKQVPKAAMQEKNNIRYFVNESKVLQQIHHNSIARLYYSFQSRNYLYLALENVKVNLLNMNLPVSLPNAKLMIAQIVAGLDYLHSRDIVYRNLSPVNIWVDEFGNVKLMNFETAKEGVNYTSRSKSFVGTLGFIAPEFLSKEGHEKPADIYALGPVLYFMLTGKTMFEASDAKGMITALKMGNYSLPYNFPADVKDFIFKVMQKDPNLRPSIDSLKNSVFLRDVNWSEVTKKRVVPRKSLFAIRSEGDLKNTQETVMLEEENEDDVFEPVDEYDFNGLS